MAKAITDNGLRRINLIAGVLHLAQMVAVLALASDFTLPITARYMSGPPGSTYGDLIVLWDAPLAIGVAVFLGLSALAHFIVVSPKFFPRYIAGLAAHRNFFRWVEYSISSSVMIVLIAQVTGISEVTALISIFGVNASMILFGWLQEKYEEPGNGGWVRRAHLHHAFTSCEIAPCVADLRQYTYPRIEIYLNFYWRIRVTTLGIFRRRRNR